jgi:hypothetical protein
MPPSSGEWNGLCDIADARNLFRGILNAPTDYRYVVRVFVNADETEAFANSRLSG